MVVVDPVKHNCGVELGDSMVSQRSGLIITSYIGPLVAGWT